MREFSRKSAGNERRKKKKKERFKVFPRLLVSDEAQLNYALEVGNKSLLLKDRKRSEEEHNKSVKRRKRCNIGGIMSARSSFNYLQLARLLNSAGGGGGVYENSMRRVQIVTRGSCLIIVMDYLTFNECVERVFFPPALSWCGFSSLTWSPRAARASINYGQ